MIEWSVYVELPGTGRYDESTADELLEALAPLHAALGLGGSVLEATVTVAAPDGAQALRTALREIKRRVPSVQPEGLIRAEVQTMDSIVADEPKLAGVREAADLLGLSPGRVVQLAARADFPKPIERLRSGPVWRHSAIRGFARRWIRSHR